MNKRILLLLLLVLAALGLAGCMRTVDQMYFPPKRSEEYNDLQSAIDGVMPGLEYCAPLSGENQQAVQMVDLDGDKIAEYLLFAKGNTEHPLRILVFQEIEDTFVHVQTIESNGSAFDQVEYIQMDRTGGVEVVVGSQVADQVIRSVSVYTFNENMEATTLLSTPYTKFLTTDLDQDGLSELFVLRPGQSETDNGVAELYGLENGILERSNEMNMSESVDNLKRMIVGKLCDGEPAVYVASSVDDTALITDVYAWIDGMLANVSFSNESGTSVKTMRNYYVYADDIDNDGVVELPSLITMKAISDIGNPERHDLIRWYAMKSDGSEVDKVYTYHNFVGGWYLELDSEWASQLTVMQQGNQYEFYLWDADFQSANRILTIFALTGQNREELSQVNERFVLYQTEYITYAAVMAEEAYRYDISQETIIKRFHMIQKDWITGET